MQQPTPPEKAGEVIQPRATRQPSNPWFKRLGEGIFLDLKARLPWYTSDWTDAWNYRVVPATALIFFANVLPGIAFSLNLIETTGQYGVAEVLISSFMAAFIFSVFGAQPLTIAGVTGPITVFNKTIYDIIQRQPNPPVYLHFIGWVYLWAAIVHWITAILNWCNFLKYVTLFSCDTFGFYVSWVYLQYGIQVLTRQFSSDSTSPGTLVSILLAVLMLVTSFLFQTLSEKPFFHRHVRRFFADYGMPISLVATSCMAYWGRFNATNPLTLPVGNAFQAAQGREWLVRFWLLEGKWVGIALPFGIVLWILFFFDHNVSSLMAQGSEFPLRKPPGFHWDFFLLGVTTFIAGLIGVPAPNGLIPQAPIHTSSLTIMGRSHTKKQDAESVDNSNEDSTPDSVRLNRRTTNTVQYEKEDTAPSLRSDDIAASGQTIPATSHLPNPNATGQTLMEQDAMISKEVPVSVVEQRVSNLAQGALCLVLLTGPFLHVLHLIPRGVLAGLFWFMGAAALQSNGITQKILFFLRDRTLTSHTDPLHRVRKSRILLFVAVQLAGFGATFAITQTVAATGFPVIIMLLIPLRTLVVPRLPFTSEELGILDGRAASPFTMESVGGTA